MARRRSRLADEGGFSMLIVLGVLTICTALTIATFSAIAGDMPLRKQSREKKSAYAAAEAGLNFYMSRLGQDNDYWTYCDGAAAPSASEQNPVNQRWSGTGTDPRRFRNVPGDTSRYTVELVPAPGKTACVPGATAADSMIDPARGTMSIRATGVAGGGKRTILATLRRRSFLDYLYFTDYETTDPSAYLGADSIAYAEANCRKYRAARQGKGCSEIQFASNDVIRGPFHTNDDILTCGGATFGRSPADKVEASGPAPGYTKVCGDVAPNFAGPFQAGAQALTVPTSNAKVAQAAVAPYILTGTHKIVFNGLNMTVTPAGQAAYTMALPANGVIYVRSGAGCGAGVSPIVQDYTEPAGCANVQVSGSYGKSLTLVSDKDIIVDGNLKKSGDFLMGLIATNFVRVFHKVKSRTTTSPYTCVNDVPAMPNPLEIEAAILSLEHSFIVDNYYCGAPLGTLKVTGAIAQRFRGPVGTTAPSGYVKDYNYDDRFRLRNPPFFLDPVAASWRILRRNEVVPGV